MTVLNRTQAGASTGSWAALSILFLPLAMSMIDLSVANLTLPSIRAGLAASDAALSWVVAGYALAYALSLVPGGRLGDRYGKKRMFLIGTTCYVLTGIAGCMATNDTQLVVCRLLHGLSGGLMIPPIAAYIQIMFHEQQRARAFGFYACVVALGATVGPVIGGWLIEAGGPGNGWRYALGYGLLLGVPAVVLGAMFLPDTDKVQDGRFDVTGAVLMSLGVLGLFVPLIQMTKGVMPPWASVSMASAAVVLAVFLWWEGRVERQQGTALLPLSLFKEPTFAFGLLLAVLSVACFTGSIYIAFAVIWQSGRGEGALAAAMVMLPFSIGSAVGPLLNDALVSRFKLAAAPFTLVCLFGGYVVCYAMLVADPNVSAMALLVPLAIAGFGSGAFFALNMGSTLTKVSPQIAGSAVGALVTVQRVGSAFGSAIVILLISQPGPAGPDDFGPATMIATGTQSVLFCVVFAGAALVVSIVEALVARASQSRAEPKIGGAQQLARP